VTALAPPETAVARTAPTAAAVRQRRRRWIVLGLQLALLVAFFGGWQLASSTGAIDEFLWSKPSSVATRVWDWLGDGTIADNLWVTLYEAAMAFAIGVAAGVIAGFALGMSDFWARVLHPYVVLLNAIPRLVFTPLFFILFGLGPSSKIALGVSIVFFLAFFNAYQGVREVNRDVANNARMLGATTRRQMTRHVLLPSALTWILSSLHVCVGFAMISAIVGEYLGSSEGLGHVISQSQGNLDTTGVMAGILVLSLVVVLVEVAVTQAERHLVRWKPSRA
jgi:NitT/TauT family transport system permease protein